MLFEILAWKKGKMECKPKVFTLFATTLDKALSEMEKIDKTNKYYIVELSLVVKKINTVTFQNSKEVRKIIGQT